MILNPVSLRLALSCLPPHRHIRSVVSTRSFAIHNRHLLLLPTYTLACVVSPIVIIVSYETSSISQSLPRDSRHTARAHALNLSATVMDGGGSPLDRSQLSAQGAPELVHPSFSFVTSTDEPRPEQSSAGRAMLALVSRRRQLASGPGSCS